MCMRLSSIDVFYYYYVSNCMKQYPHKYDSVLRFINLPSKRHLNPVNERIFKDQKINKQDNDLISRQLQEGRKYILTTIQKQTQIFDDVNYQFRFPPSIFPDKRPGQARISYEQKNQMEEVYQDLFGQKLNEQQLYQIRLRGEFEVKSQNLRAKFPSTWKINDWLVRGRVNITKIWQNGLGTCYQFLTYSLSNFIQTVPGNILKILKLPIKLIDILFGLKSIEKFFTPDYHREVIKDFWTDIMQNELRNINKIIGKDFLQLLYIKFDYKIWLKNQYRREDIQSKKYQRINLLKQEVKKIENDFNNNWNMINRNILQNIQNQNQNLNPNSQAIQKKYNEQKLKNYINYARTKLPSLNSMTYNSIEGFITIIFILYFINEKIIEKEGALSKIYQNMRQNVQKKHPIRSKNSQFLQKNVEEEYEIEKSKYQQVFYRQLFRDSISINFDNTYESIYRKYVKFREFYPTLIQQKKKIMMCLYKPTRVFTSSYLLLPPYQTIINNSSSKPYYSLKKQETLTSDTSHHFWKCSLYWMRLTTWTLNWIIFLIGNAWVGPFGLRCLFGCSSFEYDYNCNSETGQKIPILRQTVGVKFQNVLESIKRSREDFEQKPDLGLMGKNFSRICNIIECYFLRLIVVGLIITLTLYPIAILLVSLLSLIFVVTFWFWIPVAMIACYLFNIFIFQFEMSTYHNECIIRSVPLLSLVLKIIFYILQIIYSIVLLVIIAPLFCILYTLFLIVQRFLRVMTDNIMICIIALLGRTPSIDTCIARKISGPGMATNFHNKISQNKVYLLVESSLQKLFIQKFIVLTRQKIQEQQIKYRASLRYLLQPFGHNYANISSQGNKILNSTSQLLEKFNKRAQKFKQRYPLNPYNVRFNRLDLNKYFQNSVNIVKNYVEKSHIEDWIFEQNNISNRDYKQLTRFLWRQIFNSGEQIFEPVEQFDERLMLDGNITSNTKQFNKNLQFIKGTLRGQVNKPLQQLIIGRRQVSILQKDQPIHIIQKICELHVNNSGKNIFLDLSNPACLFIPPRNLDQLKNYDKENKFTAQKGVKLIELDH